MYVKGSHDPYKTFQLNPKGRKRNPGVQSHIIGELADRNEDRILGLGNKAELKNHKTRQHEVYLHNMKYNVYFA
jgi:hypothetical protein